MASDYTHIGVKKQTKRKVALLAQALDLDIYVLVERWAETAWRDALKAQLVTKAMLPPTRPTPNKNREEKARVAA